MDEYYNYKNIFYKYKYRHDPEPTIQTSKYNDNIFDLNEQSRSNIIVIDNFYKDPHKVRNFALSQDINIPGEFPGYRSESFTSEYIKNKFEDIIGEKIYNFFIIDEESIDTFYNGNFFYTIETDNLWIFQGFPFHWVSIIYLTPDAPCDSGLNIYKEDYIDNVPKYNTIDEFGNVFNRLLIFEAKHFHGPNKYFGKDKYNGRLFQVFRFSTHSNIFENKTEKIFEDKTEDIFKINNNMHNELIIIDNFYENPYKVREFALNETIYEDYLTPGICTKSFVNKKIKDCIQKILEPFDEEIEIFEMIEYGNFHSVTNNNNEERYIHIDQYNRSGVIFLNPTECYTSGTSFYLYKNEIENQKLLERREDHEKERRTNNGANIFEVEKDIYKNNENWQLIDSIGNVFNRLIIFNSKRFHQPNKYFGNNKEESRLTQSFFFNTKKKDNIFCVNKIVKTDIIIIDNFYKYPEKVREFAIDCNFTTTGNFPGLRTKSFANSKIKDKFEKIIGKKIVEFPYGNNETIYNGSFQYTLSNDKSWIHVDNNNNWGGVLYLTPNAPLNSGTKFYKFNDKSITDLHEIYKYSQDFSKWTLIDRVGNIFNRLLLFNSNRFHISDEYFGNNINNSRLFQVFFFTTEE